MKYSIIIPVHNSAAFVTKCLESVRMQTYTDYELIVVCDRCTDNTQEVITPYADVVLVTDFGNDGPPRQAGVDASHGERILFLDDDDYWMHEYVLELIDQAFDDSSDILCFGFIFAGIGYARPIRTRTDGTPLFWPSVWSKCYKREFIADTTFRYVEIKGTQAPDIDWTNRLLSLPFTYSVLDQPLYYYNYNRKGSQTDTKVYGNRSSEQILQ